MPNPEFSAQDIPAAGAETGSSIPNSGIEAQIQTPDVNSAHQFFTAKAGGAALPALSLGDGGASTATNLGNAAIGQAAAGNAAVSQAAVGNAMIGKVAVLGNAAIGSAALGTMPMPGAEQISPLVQLILKMPGLTGVMNSFFEFLNTLFTGQIFDALNPANWADHIAGAMSSLANGDHLSIGLHFLDGGDAPLLTFDGESFRSFGLNSGNTMAMHTEAGKALDAANVGSPLDNVDLQQAIFEKTSNFQYHDYAQNVHLPWRTDQMSLGPGSDAYSPGMGGYYSTTPAPAAQPPASTNVTSHSTSPAHSHASAPRGESNSFNTAKHFKAVDIKPDSSPEVGTASDGPGEYTVRHGDNLWDIAHQKLGDGSRWGDIYKMNADVIGQNPDLIHPGTNLRMPSGSDSIASADKYVVKPGDNLWDISKNHLGGGQHWGQVYHANEGVIGANPNLITPGQELSLNGIDNHIASVAGHHHVAAANISHHQPQAHAHAHSQAHSTHSHGHIAHANSPHANANSNHVAVTAGSDYSHAVTSHNATTTISAQGLYKEQAPVLAPLDGAPSAAGSGASSSLNTPATTGYTSVPQTAEPT